MRNYFIDNLPSTNLVMFKTTIILQYFRLVCPQIDLSFRRKETAAVVLLSGCAAWWG
jgi:hypothetical protein